MIVTNIEEAQTNLTRLLQQACFGEEIIIRWQDWEVRLTPLPASRHRKRGQYHVRIADDFNELPEDVLTSLTNPK